MSKLSDPKLRFVIPQDVIRQTLDFLREQGSYGHEGVVLWAGRVENESFRVTDLIIPEQHTSPVSFCIPNNEMFRLLHWISERSVVLGAQVHSHPEEAFHSEADDAHCILAHRGAISIVLPDFGRVHEHEFFRRAAFYTLRSTTDWRLLGLSVVAERFLVENA